ncbi:unnamed protein product [Fusarium fujikuroi]|nr:unnamed protein product [Fusarium fujikuroi]
MAQYSQIPYLTIGFDTTHILQERHCKVDLLFSTSTRQTSVYSLSHSIACFTNLPSLPLPILVVFSLFFLFALPQTPFKLSLSLLSSSQVLLSLLLSSILSLFDLRQFPLQAAGNQLKGTNMSPITITPKEHWWNICCVLGHEILDLLAHGSCKLLGLETEVAKGVRKRFGLRIPLLGILFLTLSTKLKTIVWSESRGEVDVR